MLDREKIKIRLSGHIGRIQNPQDFRMGLVG